MAAGAAGGGPPAHGATDFKHQYLLLNRYVVQLVLVLIKTGGTGAQCAPAMFVVCGASRLGSTFELTCTLRRAGLARLAKMHRVPPTGPRQPAVACQVERRVGPRCAGVGVLLVDARCA